MCGGSKRLAQELRAFQAVSPWQIDGFGYSNPNACDDVGFARARVQTDRRSIYRQFVMSVADAERLRQLAWSRAQQSLVAQFAPPPHGGNALGWLECADQHRARRAGRFANEVDAPVKAIRTVDVNEARRTEHHLVARRRPSKRMCGRIGVVIRFELNDYSTDPVHEQGGAYQIGGDLMHAACEERAFDGFGVFLLVCNSGSGHSSGMLKPKAEEGERLRFSVHRIS
jgi:hypothetical protein